jgi:predicted ATPase/class 3 adenylate cyclase
MPDLPTETVTFLFTDIEGSTDLLQRLGDQSYADVLAAHRLILRAAFARGGGHEIDTQGDSFSVAFQNTRDAVATAVAAQRTIKAHTWPEGTDLRVRMGLHTGRPMLAGDRYVGLDVHRAARICAAGHGGQILLSLETGQILEKDPLPDVGLRDLGSHRLKDLQQPEKIFQVSHPDLRAAFPPLKSLDAFAHNLPRQLTSFVGREQEMAEVRRLLGTTYLLTLTGVGGAGKTRLALQVAAEIPEEYPDGVWLVELAALSDPDYVPQAVASALGVREVPGRPLVTTLLDYLQRKKLLLILDNCEHLIAACARLAEAILRAGQNLRMLATSREALNIPGEVAWRVPSLLLPEFRNLPPLEELTRFESVRLFIERATAAQPSFTLTRENATWVAALCRQLDGIPLAIELAAARVPAMAVEQIAARLDDRFRLLGRANRSSLPRHQTLRAVMDWGYQLLSEQEQRVFRRLSVFMGGWSLEAAEAVCGGEGIEAFDILDLLTQLVFKSLAVMDEQQGDVRYRALETVRQYGLDKLRESKEADLIHRRHRDYFLRLAEQAKPELSGKNQGLWLDRLEREHDNLRAALAWSTAGGEAEVGLRLATAISRFWSVRGYFEEWRKSLTDILSRPDAVTSTAVRAEALSEAGRLAWRQGDHVQARAFYEESLAIRRARGDRLGIAQALSNLGIIAREQGDHAAARALTEESLEMRRAVGDRLGVAYALNNLGLIAREQGEYAAARALHEESLAIKRELGDKMGMAYAFNNLGLVASAEGDYAQARSFYQQSLALSRELGDKGGIISYALNNLGNVAYLQGDHEAACALLEESLAIKRELGDKSGTAYTLNVLGRAVREQGNHALAGSLLVESLGIRRELEDKLGMAECLEGLAGLAEAQGQHERAAQLFGAAEALRGMIGAPIPPSDRAAHDRYVASTRASLDEPLFNVAWAEGRGKTLDQAIEFGLSAASPGRKPSPRVTLIRPAGGSA